MSVKYKHIIQKKYSAGISLIEILVALFTLSIGLLGLAAMQVKTLQFNQSANLRTTATFLASDILDRIRTNPDQTAYTQTVSSSDDCNATTCTPSEMAEFDKLQWTNRVTSELPNGSGTVTEAGGLYTVTINWDDRDGVGRTFIVEARL